MNGSHATILTIAVAVLTLGSTLGPVAAHESTGTDLNTLVLDDVWDTFGPSGPAENEIAQAFEALGYPADSAGGNCTASYTHHFDPATDTGCQLAGGGEGGDTHTPTFYQCDGADAQDHPDGDIQIQADARNPFFHSSLENGIFEATGTFFVDIEFTGAHADEIDEVWFIYFHTFPWPASKSLCQGPYPLPGAYVEYVTGDTDGRNGWEIPVNTLTVPDMAYGAGIRALDADGNVLKTGYVYANVNNYLNDLAWQPSSPEQCQQGSDGCNIHDVTPPWPVVKGAEGKIKLPDNNAAEHCPNGVAFEFGEALASFEVIEGGSYSEFPSTPRDSETVPLTTVDSEAFGPSYCVATTQADRIIVRATDEYGNVALRTVTDF